MGVVYEAHDPKLDRKVAIKTILKGHLLDEEVARDYSARFVREAQAVARLSHPNIVAVHDFGEQDEAAYIVMEFVHGRELAAAFAAGERFDPARAVDIGCELLAALAYAHARGVVHRDVKPANVMLDAAGHVKLTDFGVARLADSSAERTQPGTMVGTPSYMAPEQIRGLAVGSRADLFAAGVVVYQMLTGQRPFAGQGAFEVQRRIVHDDPLPPSAADPALTTAFDAAVLRALAKEPADRHADAAVFATALSSARAAWAAAQADDPEATVVRPAASSSAAPKAATIAQATRTEPTPAPTRPAPRRAFVGAAVALLAAGGSAAAWWMQRTPSRPPAAAQAAAPAVAPSPPPVASAVATAPSTVLPPVAASAPALVQASVPPSVPPDVQPSPAPAPVRTAHVAAAPAVVAHLPKAGARLPRPTAPRPAARRRCARRRRAAPTSSSDSSSARPLAGRCANPAEGVPKMNNSSARDRLRAAAVALLGAALVAGCAEPGAGTAGASAAASAASAAAPVPVAAASAPAAPAPPPPTVPFDEAVLSAANTLLGRATLPPPGAQPYDLVIDPLIDGVTGMQTSATQAMGARIVALIRDRYPQYAVRPFTAGNVQKSPLVLVGTFTGVNADRKTEGRRDAYRICLALADLKTGKLVGKGLAFARPEGVDPTPSAFFRDAPAFADDPATQGYIRTCQGTRAGDPIHPLYIDRIVAGALIAEAGDAYAAGRYKDALELYRTVLAAPAGTQLRAYSGLYLTNWRLGRRDDAARAFGQIVDFGLESKRLGVKFLFRPGSTGFWSDPHSGNVPYPVWLQEIATHAAQRDACLEVAGHASPSGPEPVNERLSLLRAEAVRAQIAQRAPALAPRMVAHGIGLARGAGRQRARRRQRRARPARRIQGDRLLRRYARMSPRNAPATRRRGCAHPTRR